MEINKNQLPPLTVDESMNNRRLNNDEFKAFKIYIDLTYMKYQASFDPN
jgi:hypothetical protein